MYSQWDSSALPEQSQLNGVLCCANTASSMYRHCSTIRAQLHRHSEYGSSAVLVRHRSSTIYITLRAQDRKSRRSTSTTQVQYELSASADYFQDSASPLLVPYGLALYRDFIDNTCTELAGRGVLVLSWRLPGCGVLVLSWRCIGIAPAVCCTRAALALYWNTGFVLDWSCLGATVGRHRVCSAVNGAKLVQQRHSAAAGSYLCFPGFVLALSWH